MKKPLGTNPVQRVAIGREYKSSEGARYRTKKSEAKLCGGKTHCSVSPAIGLNYGIGSKKMSGHEEYGFSHGPFENGCYDFATKIGLQVAGLPLNATSDHFLHRMVDGVRSDTAFVAVNQGWKDTYTGAADGELGRFAVGEGANPQIGDAYTTVPKTGARVDGCNFHVAAVVTRMALIM